MSTNVVEKTAPKDLTPLEDFCTYLSMRNFSDELTFCPIIISSEERIFIAKKSPRSSHKLEDLRDLAANEAFNLPRVLSSDECSDCISAAEKIGLSWWDESKKISSSIRDCHTIECFLPSLTDGIWRRIQHGFEGRDYDTNNINHELHRSLLGVWLPTGLNPHVLISRYDPGGHFFPHVDGSSIVDINHRSFFSVIIYLNTVKSGGGTAFFDRSKSQQEIIRSRDHLLENPRDYEYLHEPYEGDILLFDHNLLHEGLSVGRDSVKYIIRTDLMFKRKTPIFQSPKDQQALKMIEEAQKLESDGDTNASLELLMKVRKVSLSVAEVYSLD